MVLGEVVLVVDVDFWLCGMLLGCWLCEFFCVWCLVCIVFSGFLFWF